jgi:tetratricopeptide (TPR) repeat protein
MSEGLSRHERKERYERVTRARALLSRFPADGEGADGLIPMDRGPALRELGFALFARGRFGEAVGVLAEAEDLLARRGPDAGVPAVRLKRAGALMALGRDEEALELTEPLTEPGADLGIADLAVGVRHLRVFLLSRLGRWSELSVEAQALLVAVGSDPPSRQRFQIVWGNWAQAHAARQLGQPELTLPLLDAAIAAARRWPAEEHDQSLRDALARAMLDRAMVLENLGQSEAAQAAYGDFVAAFRPGSGITLRKAIWLARARKFVLRHGAPPSSKVDATRISLP